jgi:hypothetical protein
MFFGATALRLVLAAFSGYKTLFEMKEEYEGQSNIESSGGSILNA